MIRQLDELGPQPRAFFETVALILHAGGVTAPTAIDWCEQLGPTLVVEGVITPPA